MKGVRFEILARTTVSQLSPSYPRPHPHPAPEFLGQIRKKYLKKSAADFFHPVYKVLIIGDKQ